MVYTVNLPAITVTLETQDGILPDGTMIQLSVPVKGLPRSVPFDSAQGDSRVTSSDTNRVRLSGVEAIQTGGLGCNDSEVVSAGELDVEGHGTDIILGIAEADP